MSKSIKKRVLESVMTSVMCILGPITMVVPMSPVPISLFSFVVYITLYVLGRKSTTISCCLYLLIGATGIPVFSNFTGGAGIVFGPTGGYLIGYIFMAQIGGWFLEKFPKNRYMQVLGMISGTVCCYFFGTAWLVYQSRVSVLQAVFMGVLPFVVFDFIKILLAYYVGNILRKRYKVFSHHHSF